MKFIFAILSLISSGAFAASSSSRVIFQCQGVANVQSLLIVSIAADLSGVGLIAMTSTHSQDLTGDMSCTGPLEDHYLCAGKLKMSGSATTIDPMLVMPLAALRAGAGVFSLSNVPFNCRRTS